MLGGLIGVTAVSYVIGLLLLWRERSWRPLLMLVAGSMAMLTQPVWARLFGTATTVGGRMLTVGERYSIPLWTVVGGGVLLALPTLIIWYGLRHRWMGRHYAANWVFFVLFVLFFLILDALYLRSRMLIFARPQIPSGGLPESVLHIMLLAGVSFGILYTAVATRHFALRIAFVPLLMSGVLASLLFNGILASPYWVIRFLRNQGSFTLNNNLVLVGAFVAMALVIWAIHLLATGLHLGRRQNLQWR